MWPRSSSRSRLWLLLVIVLAVIGLGTMLVGVLLMLRAPESDSSAAFAPAQEGEFLAVIAPFQRQGGDPQPIGSTLANDLRQVPGAQDLFRVETLPRAPVERALSGILETYTPAVLVTGAYDGASISSRIDLHPPGLPRTPAAAANGGAVIFPSLEAATYRTYAPQGNEKPLLYLQTWITGQSHFWNGRYKKALPFLQEAVRLLPRQVPVDQRQDMDAFASDINWQLGYIAGVVEQNWQAARDHFETALRQNPNAPLTVVGLAMSYAQLGDLPRAQALILDALRTQPESWQLYFALGQIALIQGDTSAANAAFEKAIALIGDPQTADRQRALADIYATRGAYRVDHDDPDGAKADLQKAVDLGRDDAFVRGSLAWAAYLGGDFTTAVAASAAATQNDPERIDLAFNHGLLLLAASQIDEASAAYDRAIELTLKIEDQLDRSKNFGVAYSDLDVLRQKRPDLEQDILAIQKRIETANG